MAANHISTNQHKHNRPPRANRRAQTRGLAKAGVTIATVVRPEKHEPPVMTDFDTVARFASQHETAWPRDPEADPDRWGIHHVDTPPYNRLFGPVHPRGPSSGVVLEHGEERFAWGEPDRADLTYSVAKTYLALLAGLAHDRGLLPDLDLPVGQQLPGIGFDEGHNRRVTWRQLLQQTSEWEGVSFGIPDTVDRNRVVEWQPEKPLGAKGEARPLREPGSYWEYNDVRINQLSWALMHLFARPIPEVFGEAILEPLGATSDWRWVGYDNAWVDLPQPDGSRRRVQSVPGGTHWGAGISISARDQARIGQMMLAGGLYAGRRILSEAWIRRMAEPCPIAPFYGLLTWLNAGRKLFPSAGPSSLFGIGAGGQYTWIDREHDRVVVVRWVQSAHIDRLLSLISQALEARGGA